MKVINSLIWKVKSKKLKKIGSGTTAAIDVSIHGGENIVAGNNVHFGKRVSLQTWETYNGSSTGYNPQLSIGNDVTITNFTYISCLNKIEIGDGTLIGQNSFIVDNSHGKNNLEEINIKPVDRALYSKGPIIIGKNVWIGRGVTVLPNVNIGDGAIIGANSVVSKDIPPYSISAGVPAKIIRFITGDVNEE